MREKYNKFIEDMDNKIIEKVYNELIIKEKNKKEKKKDIFYNIVDFFNFKTRYGETSEITLAEVEKLKLYKKEICPNKEEYSKYKDCDKCPLYYKNNFEYIHLLNKIISCEPAKVFERAWHSRCRYEELSIPWFFYEDSDICFTEKRFKKLYGKNNNY